MRSPRSCSSSPALVVDVHEVLLEVFVGVEGALPGWGVGKVLLERIGTGLTSPPAGRKNRVRAQ